jgi:MFS family permease
VLGRDPVVVLSHDLWRRRFGGDRAIIGRGVVSNGQRYTVVGVAGPYQCLRGNDGGVRENCCAADRRKGTRARFQDRYCFLAWIVGALLQGIGTAMVYPTLLAAISDVAHPEWRATTMGVYRFWRDLGYPIGALISGIVADLLGMQAAIRVVAVLTLISGLQAAIMMRDTLAARRAEAAASTQDPAVSV